MAMHKNRILFRKNGRAKYISHLDLMSTFQKAILRADIPIWQTQGFNKHIYVSMALPLSLGYSSNCEIMEFDLEDTSIMQDVPNRLNAVLPEGIEVIECYEAKVALKKIADLKWQIALYYDNGTPDSIKNYINEFLNQESHIIQKKSKKSKKGYTELDIIPMVKGYSVVEEDNKVIIEAVLSAANPGLNPSLLIDAITAEYPDIKPDFASYHRLDVYGEDNQIFR